MPLPRKAVRIGQDENYLSIEASAVPGDSGHVRVRAFATASGREFSASHDAMMIATDELTLGRFAEFESFNATTFEIACTEGGWIRFDRNIRGYITVRYRICAWKISVAMEGGVLIEGEHAGSFCREFGRLIRTRR